MTQTARTTFLLDLAWLLVCGLASSAWCVTAARELGGTYDEPVYLHCGLEHWRTGSSSALMRLGTMPLPVDAVTLPLYLRERWTGVAIDPVRDWEQVLPWARAVTLLFWWALLIYAFFAGRALAGPWAGRLAVALLAWEPSFLAHASLATTDLSVTGCLLALVYHFRTGRDSRWLVRVGVPGLWFGLALTAKASMLVYGPLCLLVVGLEHLLRTQVLPGLSGRSVRDLVRQTWARLRPLRRDMTVVVLLGLVVTFAWCGCDWQTEPTFVSWAHSLPEGRTRDGMVWLAEHLCIFNNAAVGMIRQVTHNVRGHGAYLLGQTHRRALWYYFPLLLTIKLTLSLLVLLGLVLLLRPWSLLNWAFLAGGVVLALSPAFRVQIGIRMILPVIALCVVGLSAALVQAIQQSEAPWRRWLLLGSAGVAPLWSLASAVMVWPQGLCYVNELWGGTEHGYTVVSEANYDWGQGLKELAEWQQEHHIRRMAVCYYGTDPLLQRLPVESMPFHSMKLRNPDDVRAALRGRYLAISTTMLYGMAVDTPGIRQATAFLRRCQPVGRTSTFLIFDFTRVQPQQAGPNKAGPETPGKPNEHPVAVEVGNPDG